MSKQQSKRSSRFDSITAYGGLPTPEQERAFRRKSRPMFRFVNCTDEQWDALMGVKSDETESA